MPDVAEIAGTEADLKNALLHIQHKAINAIMEGETFCPYEIENIIKGAVMRWNRKRLENSRVTD